MSVATDDGRKVCSESIRRAFVALAGARSGYNELEEEEERETSSDRWTTATASTRRGDVDGENFCALERGCHSAKSGGRVRCINARVASSIFERRAVRNSDGDRSSVACRVE